jgi:broad specificity phosphatase PhoE
MSQPTTIHFVRHGEVHNPDCIYYGRLPNFHLSQNGRAQAKAAANALVKYKVAALYTSPLERTIETAEVIGDHLGLSPQISNLLLEVHSPFDGQPFRFMEERNWDVYTGSPFPYEQPNDVLERAKGFILQSRSEFPGQHVIAVTHADIISYIVLWAKQLPLSTQEKQSLYNSVIGYASISSFIYETNLDAEIPLVKHLPT